MLATEREEDVEPSWLATLTMRSALRHAAWNLDFIERLVTADDPFWAAVRDALEVVAEERRYATA